MMRKILFLMLMILPMAMFGSNLKEGDVVFQISKSKQSPLVQLATLSPWSHCGIIIEKKGGLYVLEASNVVKLTPWKQWKRRGRGGIVKIMRCKSKDKIKINYKSYLGKSYDLAFKFDNNKYYCSELVYEIYKHQLNIELCTPRKVRDYNIRLLKKKMKQRNINLNQLVVAPSDIIDSKYLKTL